MFTALDEVECATGKYFEVPSTGKNYQREVPVISEIPECPQCSTGRCAKNKLDPLSCFDTILAIDTHTHTHTHRQTDRQTQANSCN